MKIYFLYFIIITLLSCGQNENSQLQINFTSPNRDTITELKSFYLTSLPIKQNEKSIVFQNVKCLSPNKFMFKSIKNNTYIGLLTIDKNGLIYNITIDSIRIIDGTNIISKEVNLGHVEIK